MDDVQLPSAGDLFLGRWKVEGEVGKGGFSVVYRATSTDGRIAALKILLPAEDTKNVNYDSELVDRFVREARLLEQLDSPYTIRMWEYGQSPQGLMFMVFEFIDGRMLFDEIKENGALAPQRVIHVLRQTLVGLQSAHRLGILHRDIKPNNIMLFERDGDPDRVKLVDFGIAKMFGESKGLPGNDLTAAGLLVGTPRYMSPEQLRNGTLGPPSDIYSLGLCAVEMLTGRKCIPGKDRVKIVEMQLRPEPITVPPDVMISHGLRSVIDKMVQKNLHARYGSAAEALRDLEALAGDPGITGDTVFEAVPSSLAIPDKPPAAGDEETVLHRVNTAELDGLLARQKSSEPIAYDATIDARSANLGSGEWNRPAAAGQSGSGEWARPAGAQGSGEWNRPAGANGSGEVNRPAAAQSGSGEWNRPQSSDNLDKTVAATPSSSGLTQFPPSQVPNNWASGEFNRPDAGGFEQSPTNPVMRPGQPPPHGGVPAPTGDTKLDSNDALTLALSFLIPGVGHFLLGQTVKAIIALALLVVTVGFGWILLAPAATADAFLVIRARKRREVGKLEFFPDYQEIL